jgi:ribosomal protein S18 acetylase RimI-like enzyme
VNNASGIALRRATEEDADVLLPMMRALENDDPCATPFDEARRRQIFAQFVCDPTFGRVWFIENGGRRAGYVILTIGFSFEYRGKESFIDELYVLPEFRNRGIARQAMHLVAEAARELGINAIHLEVSTTNESALSLYRRLGFEHHHRTLMTKWLAQTSSNATI